MNEEHAPQQPAPEQEPPKQEVQPVRHISHSYQDDLSHAMNATDASVVQALLQDARDRETYATTEKHERLDRKWYAIVSMIFILVALGVIGYGIWKYTHLTVPVVPVATVGIFPSTDPIAVAAADSSTTTIASVVATLQTDTTLTANTPYLVPLVSDTQSQTLVSNGAFFSFLGATPDEPFVTMFSTIRLGVMNNGTTVVPFIIGSVADPIVATKEFLIDEPSLLQWFAPALGINMTTLPAQVGDTFRQDYRYNLPVRILSYTDTNNNTVPVFLYGFATDNTIVITTDASVLKAVSDTILGQN